MNNSIDKKLESIKNLNVQLGVEICNESLDLYKKMLKKFYQGYHDFPLRFDEALNEQNNELAIRLAHSLKGLTGTLGASQVEDKAEALELACRKNANLDLINHCLNNVKRDLEPLMNDLYCWANNLDCNS